MSIRESFCTAAVVTLLTATASFAAPVLIDDFADPVTQFVGDDPFMGIVAGSQVAAPVLGGYRDLYVENTPEPGEDPVPLGTTLVVNGGDLSFNNQSGQSGFGQVAYDGDDDTPTSDSDIDITGLGGVDLTYGFTSASFFFEVLRTDGDFTFEAQVWDMAGNTHIYSESIFGSFSPLLSFGVFTSEGVNMMDVGAVVFSVRSNGTESVDGALGSISVVPLPASALLLLGGLGGLAGMSSMRRRRRKAA